MYLYIFPSYIEKKDLVEAAMLLFLFKLRPLQVHNDATAMLYTCETVEKAIFTCRKVRIKLKN